MAERKKKVDRAHELPISRQCLALDISRSSAYRNPAGVSADERDLSVAGWRIYLEFANAGGAIVQGAMACIWNILIG